MVVYVPLPTRREVGGLIRLCGLVLLTAASAIVTKEMMYQTELPVLAQTTVARPTPAMESGAASRDQAALQRWLEAQEQVEAVAEADGDGDECLEDEAVWRDDPERPWLNDPNVRYFNGRPVRAARTMTMLVTAYSPDERSCGPWADGITASIHSVDTNAGRLVAADTRLLPLGSMISVPGYDEGRIVPVLDRGGAIKGHRLDVLFPTHEQARAWGVRRIRITVWEYADGMPADDYRKIRGKRRWK